MDFLDFSFSEGFAHMLVRFFILVVVNWIIIRHMYYVKSKRREYCFTFMLISVAIFFLVFFMIFVLEDMKGKTGIGIGIGLFGIFSIMRYRTDTMPVREMTYLFVLITLAVVNALAESVTLVELVATNLIIMLAIRICEWHLKVQPVKLIQYDRLELTKPERKNELFDDLKQRLGINAIKVEVGGVDLMRDMAILKVVYEDKKISGSNSVDNKLKLKITELSGQEG